MLRNGRTILHKCGNYLGCSCCNSRRVRRAQTGALRMAEKRAWKRAAREEAR